MAIVFMLSCLIIILVADLKRKHKRMLIVGMVVAWLFMQYFLVVARDQTLETWCESHDGRVERIPTVGNVCVLETYNE